MKAIDTRTQEEFEGKRILVTGGAGFLGSWLTQEIVELGGDVLSVDNLATGREENVSQLKTRKNFQFKKLDIAEEGVGERFDLIFHFASRASPEEYQQRPVETLLANSAGMRNVLENAREHNSRVIYASSSEIYGHPSIVPTPETYWGWVNPIGPRSCYDEGKRFGEALCMAYLRAYNLDVRILRIFNSYGPRIRGDGPYARSASRFIQQALHGEPLTIYGDGRQTRSFCYVTDTIRAVLQAASTAAAKGEVLNVGNPHEVTILFLADLIGRLVGSRYTLSYAPLPQDDPPRRCPDISKARSILQWQPKVDLEVGLASTIQWFRAQMERDA